MNFQQLRNRLVITSPQRQHGRPCWRCGLVGLLLLVPAAAPAQSEPNTPYKLHIVVYVAENRLLTDVFRERIERELRDGFQASLGDMARVTVSHEHPRLSDVVARGLKLSLDGWTERTDEKTHFVLIDYSGVHYEIQTRQYDGTVGRASPVVRRDRTRDRDFVAKAAALLIKQDFGVLGTVLTEPDGAKKEVKVELRGGALGDLSRWVKQGEVFALVPPGGGSPEELKFSFLLVEKPPSEGSGDGVCLCRFFHRYRVLSIAGYRCIKLGTVQGPLRLRWFQKMPKTRNIKPLDRPVTVEIRRYGFDGEEASPLTRNLGRYKGVLETVGDGEKGVFNNVAFVRVTDGLPDPKPQIPIALVDDQPIFIEVNVARDDVDPLFSVRVSSWRSYVADSLQMQANLFKRLEMLGAKAQSRQEIIQEAERGLTSLHNNLTQLRKDRNDILREAQEKKFPLKMQREDKQLADLEEGEKTLKNFIDSQKDIDAKENDPQRKKWLSDIERAKLLEKDLELGQAIAIYERIQKEGFNNADLDAHLKELHEQWDPGNAEPEARGFIYGVWPTLDTSRLEDNIPKAADAFQKCQKAGDVISIRKLLKGTEQHADRLAKELSELRPTLIADDVEPARKLQKVSKEILDLGTAIQDYLKAKAPGK